MAFVDKTHYMANRAASRRPAVTAIGEVFPSVKGICPACGNRTLFLGAGGFLTCSLGDCHNPMAANELLGG